MDSKYKIIGIDPGKNGGVAVINMNRQVENIVAMPTTDLLWSTFKEIFKKEKGVKKYVFLENVHSRPTDGVVGAFTFGYHFGYIESILHHLVKLDNILRVDPRKWQNSMGYVRGKEETKYEFKKRLLLSAQLHLQGSTSSDDWLLYGDLSRDRRRTNRGDFKLTLKTCDAYLIALYGLNQIKGIK